MDLWVAAHGYGHLEGTTVDDLSDRADELGGGHESPRVGSVGGIDASRRIPAQQDEVSRQIETKRSACRIFLEVF